MTLRCEEKVSTIQELKVIIQNDRKMFPGWRLKIHLSKLELKSYLAHRV